MKFSLIKNIIGLVSLSGLALAKTELNCDGLKNVKGIYVDKCKENGKGEIDELTLSFEDDIQQDAIDKVFSIDSIKSLTFSSGATENLKLSLEKLINLENLTLEVKDQDEFGYRDYYYFKVTRSKFAKNGLTLPKSIKQLTLEGAELNQDVADEISSLPKLEELILTYTKTNGVDLKNFANNKNLSTVTINEVNASEYDGYLEDNVVNNFKSVKTLILRAVKLNNTIIKNISELSNLENLGLYQSSQDKLDYTPLKNLSKLTLLDIGSPNTNGDYGEEGGVRVLYDYDEDILKYLPHLKKLNLDYIKMSPEFVKSINTLSDLEELSIYPRKSYYDKKEKTVVFDISSFNNLNKLTSIKLDGTLITVEDENGDYIYYNGKFDLSKFKNLKKIDIENGITQEHINQIATLPNVEEVILREEQNELHFDILKNLPKLKLLKVNNKEIDLPKAPVATTTITVTVSSVIESTTSVEAEKTTSVESEPTSTVEAEKTTSVESAPTSTVEAEKTTSAVTEPTSSVAEVVATTSAAVAVPTVSEEDIPTLSADSNPSDSEDEPITFVGVKPTPVSEIKPFTNVKSVPTNDASIASDDENTNESVTTTSTGTVPTKSNTKKIRKCIVRVNKIN